MRSCISKITILFFYFFILVFSFSQVAGATIYAPGATLEPDCAPGAPLCGVSTPAVTNIGNSDLTLDANRLLTLDGFTLTFEGISFDVIIDDNGDISVGGGDISTPSSGLTLQANALSSGTIQIGSGVASTTPDLLVVDLKSDAGDPAGTNGAVYYNDNTDKLRCFENGAWGDCIFQSNGSAQNLTLARIGNSTFSTLQDLQNVFHSAGWVAGGAITDAGGATIDVAAGNGLIRSSNTATATISYFDWTAMSGIAIPLDSVRYIGIEYNGGSPQISVRTSDNWNLKTDFPIGVVFNEAGVLSIYSDLQAVGDHAANMIQREHETMPLSRDERNGGLMLGEDGTRNVTLSAGAVWDRLNRYTIPAINTSISGDFTAYYRDGGSGFTKVTGLTQWPNGFYDDNSGVLATITAGKYSTLWFFVDTAGELIMIYGRDEYDTSALADSEMMPDTLPERVMINGKLVGKIIFQASAGIASEIISAFSMSTISGGNTNHANLTGLDYLSSGHTGFANALLGVNDNITSMTGISSIAPTGALTITSAGASIWSTSAGALTLDSAAALNLGTVNATSLNIGTSGVTTTNNGNLSILGNFITPRGVDYTTTGTQNNVDFGVGSLFQYAGNGASTFTGIAGGVDGRFIRISNDSLFNITLTNEDGASSLGNRISTPGGSNVVIGPQVSVGLVYDDDGQHWHVAVLPASATTVSNFAFIQSGNAFGTAATLGTTDANELNLITSGATRFSLASGASTLTGTGATTLASNAGSVLNITSGTTGTLNMDSGTTGAVNIGNNANAKIITVGNIIGATAVNINTGTGGSTFTTTDGVFNLNTGTGSINIGVDAVAKNLTIGNVTGASSLNLNAGSGGGIFTSSSGLTLNPFDTGVGDTTEIRFAELVASGVNYVGFKAPDLLAGNVIWTLPDVAGDPGDVLTTDGSNVLSWSASGACPTCVVNTTKFNVDEPTGNITEINDVATSFPAIQGGSGDVLTNDGAGNLTWSPSGAGSAALSSVSAATGNATIGNGNNNINWNWVLSGATNGFNISETSASSGTGYLQRIATLATSTAKPFSLGARGTTIFDTTATGGLTLGDSATLNTPITLQSGTGAINIGADAVAKTITIGNTTGATAVNINSGSGDINLGGDTIVSGSNTFTTGTGTTTINSTAVTLAGNSTVIDMTGTGILGLNTNTNRAISTGTGLLTTGGDLSVLGASTFNGNFITPKGSDYLITGTQDDVDLGPGSVFNYTGVGVATFTGFAGGVDGRQIRIVNNSSSSITLNHQDIGSVAANRLLIGSGLPIVLSQNSSVTLLYDSSISRWRLVQIPASSAIIGTFAFLQNGNAYGTTATLGTTDANGLNFITSGTTRFGIASGSATLTGTGSTTITSTASLTLDATTALNLGTSTATSVSIGATGVTTTNNGPLTSTQTLTASNGLTLTTGALNLTATSGTLTLGSTVLAGASPLVFDGATANANTTTFAITDPSGIRTITFPDASITVNAAANISGTTLASNVITSSLTATGALSSGSIASGFGSISTTNNITTSANISTTGTGTVTSAGTLTASNGFTQTTGALSVTATSGSLALSGLSASSINSGANNLTFTSGNFNTTATGINNTAIGATTASTGAFTTLSSTGVTNLGTSGASNVNIATAGTGNVTVGNATGTFALASSGGLNVTTGGVLTGVASIDTIATSATAITFAGAGTMSSTGANALTLDGGSSGVLNLNNNSTGNILIGGGSGSTGCTVINSTGAFTCSGAITTTATSGNQGWWNRTGTTLSPATSGDVITTSGNISATGTGTITSAGLLTGSNGLTLTTGALNLTGTSGALTLSGLGASSISTTSNNLSLSTVTSGTLSLTSAGALNLSAGAASTWALANATNALNFDSNTLTIDALNNRVGIGLNNPSSNLDIFTSDGVLRFGEAFPNKSGSTDNGISMYSEGTFKSGLFTEENGALLSYGINVSQMGDRDTAKTGAIFRMDTRATSPYFSVKRQAIGGSTEFSDIQISQAGDIGLGGWASDTNSFPGNVSILVRGAAVPGLVVRGASAQTANLTEWRNNADAILLNITSAGSFVTSNLGVDYTDSDTNPTCAAGEYKIFADTSETKLKKCQNGVISDLNAIPDINSFTDNTLAAAWTDANTNELWNDATRPNITPRSTASEILVMVTVRGTVANSGGGDTNNPVARIDREIGSTADCADTNTVGPTIGDLFLEAGGTEVFSLSTVFVDTPSTTSNVSYTVCSSSDSLGLSDTTTATQTEVTLFEVNDAADLAEIYSTNDNSIGMGDVVSLDPSLTAGVQKSEGVNDKKVVGIVSSKPAMVIGGINNEGEGAVPVALSGRVPVKVVTENGAIEIGDYLSPSSTPGVAMKSNGGGIVIGQAMSAYDAEGLGIVTVFVKNFDLGNVGEVAVLLGDISPLVNADGSDNGLSTLVADIQAENARDPIVILGDKISNGKQFLTDFVSARITAVRGYFDEVFAKKVHTEQICVKKSDGSEVCVSGDQLDALLNDANIDPEPIPEPAPEIIPEVTPEPAPENSPDPALEVDPETVLEATPEATPEPTPEPEPAPAPEETPAPEPASEEPSL